MPFTHTFSSFFVLLAILRKYVFPALDLIQSGGDEASENTDRRQKTSDNLSEFNKISIQGGHKGKYKLSLLGILDFRTTVRLRII